MTKVFISYSHNGPEHARRVRALAERLRADPELVVFFDGFVDDERDWAAWCEEHIRSADRVLIVITQQYSERYFPKENATGTGVGFEVMIIRNEIYDVGTVSPKYKVIVFEEKDVVHIPSLLKPGLIRRFLPADEIRLMGWLKPLQRASATSSSGAAVAPKPTASPEVPPFSWRMADRRDEKRRLEEMIMGLSVERIALIKANSGFGKSYALGQLCQFASAQTTRVACAVLQNKGAKPTLRRHLEMLSEDFPGYFPTAKAAVNNLRGIDDRHRVLAELKAAIKYDLQNLPSRFVLMVDGYQECTTAARDWIDSLLSNIHLHNSLYMVIAGRRVPIQKKAIWAGLSMSFELKKIESVDDWIYFAETLQSQVEIDTLRELVVTSNGMPQVIASYVVSKPRKKPTDRGKDANGSEEKRG